MRNPFLGNPDLFVDDPQFRDHIYLDADELREISALRLERAVRRATLQRLPAAQPHAERAVPRVGAGHPPRGRPQRDVLLDREPLAVPGPRAVRVLQQHSDPAPGARRQGQGRAARGGARHRARRASSTIAARSASTRRSSTSSMCTIRRCAGGCSSRQPDLRLRAPREDRAADRQAATCRTARASSCSTSSTASCSSKSLPEADANAAMKYCRSCILPDTRPNLTLECGRHLQRLRVARDQAADRLAGARAAHSGDVVEHAKSRSTRLRLPDPGQRRQGQHLAGRQVPGTRAERRWR